MASPRQRFVPFASPYGCCRTFVFHRTQEVRLLSLRCFHGARNDADPSPVAAPAGSQDRRAVALRPAGLGHGAAQRDAWPDAPGPGPRLAATRGDGLPGAVGAARSHRVLRRTAAAAARAAALAAAAAVRAGPGLSDSTAGRRGVAAWRAVSVRAPVPAAARAAAVAAAAAVRAPVPAPGRAAAVAAAVPSGWLSAAEHTSA